MKKLAISVMALAGILLAVGQTKPTAKAKKTEPVYVAANNGKVISEDGHQHLSETDFISIRVKRDTIFFTLKEDALKRLDANPTKNYKQEKTNNKKKSK